MADRCKFCERDACECAAGPDWECRSMYMGRMLTKAVNEATTERARAEAAEAKLAEPARIRCDECGSSDHIYSGPPDCPGCGAPVCCQICCRHTNELDGMRKRAEAAEAKRDSLQRHYDAAGPEHDLLSLLDLYHDRQRKAEAERDAAERASEVRREECERLVMERDRYIAALQEIARPGGTPYRTDSDEERADFWKAACETERLTARKALEEP